MEASPVWECACMACCCCGEATAGQKSQEAIIYMPQNRCHPPVCSIKCMQHPSGGYDSRGYKLPDLAFIPSQSLGPAGLGLGNKLLIVVIRDESQGGTRDAQCKWCHPQHAQ